MLCGLLDAGLSPPLSTTTLLRDGVSQFASGDTMIPLEKLESTLSALSQSDPASLKVLLLLNHFPHSLTDPLTVGMV